MFANGNKLKMKFELRGNKYFDNFVKTNFLLINSGDYKRWAPKRPREKKKKYKKGQGIKLSRLALDFIVDV